MARLTVEKNVILITPLRLWRQVFRLPVVQIPLGDIERATRIWSGIKFVAPGNPAVNGTRFKTWSRKGLIELLQSRGIRVDSMSVPERVAGYFGDLAVAFRPGWIWRDRGGPALLESAVAFGAGVTVLYLLGFFARAPAFFIALFAFTVGASLLGWVVGYRRRQNAVGKRRR